MQVTVSRMISAVVFTAVFAGAMTLGYVKGASAQQVAASAQNQPSKLQFDEYDGTWTLIGDTDAAAQTDGRVPKVIRFQGGAKVVTVSLDGREPDVYKIDGSEVRSILQPSGAVLDRWTRLTIIPDALALTTRTQSRDSVRIATSVLSLSGVLTVDTLVSTADVASGTINVPANPRNVRVKATYERAR
jgi:hypothetical protein